MIAATQAYPMLMNRAIGVYTVWVKGKIANGIKANIRLYSFSQRLT